ncbi:ribosomal protein 63, mitochondrial-like [Amphibalanus amphitrite]|uniref:ribosomal protein 63, mitochondrial-like n=1 Tax=Amphibalanus amphitrite TaxID=1232801 RepID=UPI001C929469|nr:ribosomal protein 63, mitochondrial-like [Amphibalanus amphitrite]XP_043228617.1 ribosomal protein 63, mitochondrial-like [Amphibalanus amphitrite]
MRLAVALLRKKMPNGNIWTGKHRLPHRVQDAHLDRMQRRLAIEERNMLLLRNPYLTLEQSAGIGAALNKRENWLDEKKLLSAMVLKGRTKPMNHVRIEDRFRVLYNSDGWE